MSFRVVLLAGRSPEGAFSREPTVQSPRALSWHRLSWTPGATCSAARGSALAAPRLRLVDPAGPDPALALVPLPGSCLRALGTWAYLVPLLSSSSVLLPGPQAPRGQRCFRVCAASPTPSPGPARVNTAGMAQEPAREALRYPDSSDARIRWG